MTITENTSVSKLLFYIAEYQAVQKRHAPDSPEWQAASRELQPLFAAMAARQKEQ